ncbi:MAG: hypothetical protein ACI4PG_02310 [Candidatus Ventricola sp.]
MRLSRDELTRIMKPDTYLLYETRSQAASNTSIRFALEISEDVDGAILGEAVNEAIRRFPYFSVRIEVRDGSFIFVPNSLPIVVMETRAPAAALGSEAVNYHLNYVDYLDDTIYFNVSHSITDAAGYMPFIKSVLYQYLIRAHSDEPLSCEGIWLPDSGPVPGEFDFPSAADLPESDFSYATQAQMGYFPAQDYMQAMGNPDPRNDGYYCVSIKQREFMKYIHSNDASPAAIVSVFMFKALAPLLPREADALSAGIAFNFRKGVNCANAYHSISTALHANYKRSYLDIPVDRLGTMTRGMIILQSQPENSVIHMKNVLKFYQKVDSLSTIEEKRRFCLNEGLFTRGCKDTYNVSYVGKTDFGSMSKYVRSLNTLAYGNLLVEINAIGNMFYITFNQVIATDKYILAFLNELSKAGLSYSVSNYRVKNIAPLVLPDA